MWDGRGMNCGPKSIFWVVWMLGGLLLFRYVLTDATSLGQL